MECYKTTRNKKFIVHGQQTFVFISSNARPGERARGASAPPTLCQGGQEVTGIFLYFLLLIQLVTETEWCMMVILITLVRDATTSSAGLFL